GGKNSLNRLIRCVCGKKIGPDPRNFNQRVSLGRNDLLIRTFLKLILTRKVYFMDEALPAKAIVIAARNVAAEVWRLTHLYTYKELLCLLI
ncbi:hypothetical protein KD815_25755, partial [Klebsiella quasipneumoniae]